MSEEQQPTMMEGQAAEENPQSAGKSLTPEDNALQPGNKALALEESIPKTAENTSTSDENTSHPGEKMSEKTSDENTSHPGEKMSGKTSDGNTSQPGEKASEKTIPQPAEQTSEEKTPKPARSTKSAEKTPEVGHAEPTLSPNSPFWAPLNAGWVRELVYRQNVGPNNKKADAYYKSPVGKKYRSLKEIERAIDEGKPGFDGLSTQNFTYNQYPLGVNDPSREVIRGSDPHKAFNHTKRSSEAGESGIPPTKKPKRSIAKPVPYTPDVAQPKPRAVTALPKKVIMGQPNITPRPTTVVGTPVRRYPQTAVRSQMRPYQQHVIGARNMGFGSMIRPIATNLLMNRTVQKVKTKAFTTPSAALPPSPQKSAEEIVCEPAIYEGDDPQVPAEVIMEPDIGREESEQDETGGEGSVRIEIEANGCEESEQEDTGSEHAVNGLDESISGKNGEESVRVSDENTDDSEDGEHKPPSEPDSTTQCLCGMCVVPVTQEKIVCCAVVDDLFKVKTPLGCITFHPSFEKLILDEDVLDMTRHLLCLKTKNVNKKALLNAQEPMSITWRYIAYKQFVSWINKCLQMGMQKKVAIPSCVVQAVRVRFPERNCNNRVLKFT